MKLKGSKEDIELATKIQSANLQIVDELSAALEAGKFWPDEKGDKPGNEVKKRYRTEAAEALNHLRKELSNPDAAFYQKGAHAPILSLEVARQEAVESDRSSKGDKDFTPKTPLIDIYQERLETMFSYLTQGKEFTYMKHVPDYSFSVK